MRLLKKEITEERKNEILGEIEFPVKSIEYAEFLELYTPYSNEMEEQEFAAILNISYNSYIKLKNGKERATVGSNQENRIKYEFNNPQYYSIEQLEVVAKKYGITINEILGILYSKNDYYITQITKVLQEKGKIFIGEKKINDDFIEKYNEKLFRIAHDYSKALGINLHTSMYSEDISQEALIVTIQTKGDVVENLSEEIAIEALVRNIKVRIKFKHKDFLKNKKDISLDQTISTTDNRSRWNDKISSSNIKIEDFEEDIKDDQTPISAIQNCLLMGMSRSESLKFVMRKFNLKKEELLEVLQKELLKTKSIRISKDGKRYLAEREK